MFAISLTISHNLYNLMQSKILLHILNSLPTIYVATNSFFVSSLGQASTGGESGNWKTLPDAPHYIGNCSIITTFMSISAWLLKVMCTPTSN